MTYSVDLPGYSDHEAHYDGSLIPLAFPIGTTFQNITSQAQQENRSHDVLQATAPGCFSVRVCWFVQDIAISPNHLSINHLSINQYYYIGNCYSRTIIT